jgi:hypothetical protein
MMEIPTEIIDGELYVSGPASVLHRSVLMNLGVPIWIYLRLRDVLAYGRLNGPSEIAIEILALGSQMKSATGTSSLAFILRVG